MCAAIGVDPLSSSKGFWAEVLGMGDFYYELSVRVVEYCMAYRDATGGLIALSTIAKSLKAEPADIETALGKLRTLGKGYQVIGKGSTAIVQAVPGEFSDDAAKLVEYSSKHNGMVCQSSGLRV
jgi:ESCRT-II complex subunit VPS22